MRVLGAVLCGVLFLAACATTPSPKAEAEKEYRAYCRTHAREIVGEADEQSRYVNCLTVKGRHEVIVEELE